MDQNVHVLIFKILYKEIVVVILPGLLCIVVVSGNGPLNDPADHIHPVADLGWFPGFHGTPLSCTGLLFYKLYSRNLHSLLVRWTTLKI